MVEVAQMEPEKEDEVLEVVPVESPMQMPIREPQEAEEEDKEAEEEQHRLRL